MDETKKRYFTHSLCADNDLKGVKKFLESNTLNNSIMGLGFHKALENGSTEVAVYLLNNPYKKNRCNT